MQYQEAKGGWAPEAHLRDAVDPATATRAKTLAPLLDRLIQEKTTEFAEGQCQQSQQFELLQSLTILHKFLLLTADHMALHGPTVAFGFQKGGQKMRKWDKVQWSTLVDSPEEMPGLLMNLIEQYLELNEVFPEPAAVPEVSAGPGLFDPVTAYTKANLALLNRHGFPDKIELEELRLTMEDYVKDRAWEAPENAFRVSTVNFFTSPGPVPAVPAAAFSVWMDVKVTVVWVLKRTALGTELFYADLNRIVQRTLNRAEPGPVKGALCTNFASFGGWEPETIITTIKDGITVVLAAKFKHQKHGQRIMMQVKQLPHNIAAAFGL